MREYASLSMIGIRLFELFLLYFSVFLISLAVFIGLGIPIRYSILFLMAGQLLTAKLLARSQREHTSIFPRYLLIDVIFDYFSVFLVEVLTVSGVTSYLENGILLYISLGYSIVMRHTCNIHLDIPLKNIRVFLRLIRVLIYIFISLKILDYIDWEIEVVLSLILFIAILSLICWLVSLLFISRNLMKYRRVPRIQIWLLVLELYIAVLSLSAYISILKLLSDDTSDYLKNSAYICTMTNFILLVCTEYFKNDISETIIEHYRNTGKIVNEPALKSMPCKLAKLKRITSTFFELFDEANVTFISNDEPHEGNIENSENTCIICFTYQANSVLSECFHGGICHICGEYILKSRSPCSLCRVKSDSMYLIELDHDKIYKIKEQLVLES